MIPSALLTLALQAGGVPEAPPPPWPPRHEIPEEEARAALEEMGATWGRCGVVDRAP